MESIFIVFLLTSLSFYSGAQSRETRFHNFNIEDGLSHSLVQGIVEDSLGFLWIATQDGLNRYDGSSFKSYFKGVDERSLSESWISEIFIDRFNQIWLYLGPGGFERFDTFKETFHYYGHDHSDSGSISSNFLNEKGIIHGVFYLEDEAGTLWIGTDNGLNRFNRQEDTFELVSRSSGDLERLGRDQINCLEEDLEHQILIGTEDGLLRYDPESGKFSQFTLGPDGEEHLGNNRITCISARPDSSIWVGTVYGGLGIIEHAYGEHPRLTMLIDVIRDSDLDPTVFNIMETESGHTMVGTRKGLYLVTKDEDRYVAKVYNGTEKLRIFHILEDEQGYIWAGTNENVAQSLFRIEPDLVKMETFTFDEGDPFSFTGGKVQFIHNSRTGLIWIGSEKEGLYMVDLNTKEFRTINTNSRKNLHITNNEVYSIFEDTRQRLYVGTKTELNRIDLKDGTLRNYSNDYGIRSGISYEYSNKFPADLVGVIKDAGDGRLWLGSFDYKLGLYDPYSEDFLHFHHNQSDEKSFLGWSIRSICVTKSGDTYIAATSPGLCKLNEDGHSFSYFPVVENGNPSGTNDMVLQYLYEDSDSILWIGTARGGLNRFDPKTGKFRHFNYSRSDSLSISSSMVKCILEPEIYEDDILWIGTNDGLNKFNKRTRKFTTYNIGEGPANTIHGILEDKFGRLWLSTNRGLVEFDPITERIRKYTAEDGVQGDEFNQGAFFKNTEGVMYFGGTEGITYFLPENIKVDPQSAPVVISSIRISGKTVLPNDTINGRIILDKSILYSDKITLTHKDRFVRFDFVSPLFISSKKLRYRIMLEGLEENWNEVDSKQRFISYTNLPSGDYKLLIWATNSEGSWSENPTSFAIQVLPPYWRTPWFKLAIAGMIIVIFLLILQVRTRRLQNQKRVLEKEVEERTRDLKNANQLLEVQKNETQEMADKLHESDQMKLKFFTNISHEFRTPLTLIMGPTEKLMKEEAYEDTAKVKRQLGLIYRNEKRLFKLINQLLEIRKVETGNLGLSVAESDIIDFLHQIYQLFMPYAEQKNIEFQFISDSSEFSMFYDADKIEKIFYNLLSNAFKHTPDYGKILFSVNVDEGQEQQKVKISVIDNGPGISEEHLPHIFNRFYQISNKYQSGKISSGIGLSLSRDLVKKHYGEINVVTEMGTGTTFEVCLPLDNDVYQKEEFEAAPEADVSMEYMNAMLETFDQSDNEDLGEPTVAGDLFRILVVEDNLEMQKFLYEELSGMYSVMLAQNGAEGLDTAQENLPDLILSDVMMPEMDGMELCKRIKNNELTSHVPVILLTAKSTTESQLSGLELGADDYITKPFNVESLKLKIRNILSGRKQLVEKFSKDSNYIPENIKISQIDQGFLEKFVKLVEDNIDNSELSGDMLACELGMSKGNLYKKLKSVTGMTVNIFMRTIRLKLAARLLEQGNYNISEVAYAVGFSNPKYFSTCFSELYSMSPKEYMK